MSDRKMLGLSIEKKLAKQLKTKAVEKETTMSKLLDLALRKFLNIKPKRRN